MEPQAGKVSPIEAKGLAQGLSCLLEAPHHIAPPGPTVLDPHAGRVDGVGLVEKSQGLLPVMEHELAIIQTMMQPVAEPLHMVGHSHGGAILARIAARGPDRVRSLTLVEPTLFFLLKQFEQGDEHDEIKAVAYRVVKYVG